MFYDQLKYDSNGLVCGIFQDASTAEVLTLAWMNQEAVQKTWETGQAHVYRRSHQRVMMKGETSGNIQKVIQIIADCDRDALIIKVDQGGGAACHKGFRSCFMELVTAEGELQVQGEPLFDPASVYRATGSD